MNADQATVPYTPFDLKRRRRQPFGRLIWPWRCVTTETGLRAPLVALNRHTGQIIGIHFRLPDGPPVVRTGVTKHYGLSIRWGRPT